ncbi:MAG: helix-turn-helix domain-containing protein [Treponemataceae bacterium]
MESFGQLLKQSRESQGIEIIKASHETSISREYIEALEDENTQVFPGEPYLVGFLRNYSEYLGLNPESMISLYKRGKIQESAVPLDLLKPDKPRFIKPLVISVSSALVLIVFILLFIFAFRKNSNKDNEILEDSQKGKTYKLSSVPIQKRVYQNDIIELTANQNPVQIKVLSTKGVLSLETPVGVQVIDLGEEKTLNIDDKEGADIGVFVADVKNDAAKGAEVRMWAFDGAESVAEKEKTENESDTGEITKASELSQKQVSSQIVLFDSNRAYPFTVEVVFRGSSLFRIAKDRKDSEENYYTAGERIIAQANNTMRFWMSNANALQISVIGDGKTEKIDIGRHGQVLVQDIKWVKDNGRYKLVVIEVD